jgi:elongator complex protein 2
MLLSTSVDSSVILWAPASFRTGVANQDPVLWINQQRFGDVGGQRLGGFVGGMWAASGNDAMAWGWNGGWRRWACSNSEHETWVEVLASTGHAGPVHGLDWSPNGNYLITTRFGGFTSGANVLTHVHSLDQTTRIHGETGAQGWHELARPQIHGYDCLDARFVTQLRFVSIGDEKVARVFDAPKRFVDTLTRLHVSKFEDIGVGDYFCESQPYLTRTQDRPEAATVPPLGLSNKATQLGDSVSHIHGIGSLRLAVAGDESKPIDEHPTVMRVPFESELAAETLWPEIEKIFGHGYEVIFCMARHLETHLRNSRSRWRCQTHVP